MIEFSVRGLEKVKAALGAYPEFVRAVPRGQIEFAARSGGGSNAEIARVQAQSGRNVWFINSADKANAARILREAAIAACNTSKAASSLGGVRASARRATAEAYETFLVRIRERITQSSTFKRGLSAAYAAWKAKHYPGQPILVATGQLRDSMRVKIDP